MKDWAWLHTNIGQRDDVVQRDDDVLSYAESYHYTPAHTYLPIDTRMHMAACDKSYLGPSTI